MEERLRTAETNIEVLKNKSRVSEHRIAYLEDKLDVVMGNMNRWNGVLLVAVFVAPFLLQVWMD